MTAIRAVDPAIRAASGKLLRRPVSRLPGGRGKPRIPDDASRLGAHPLPGRACPVGDGARGCGEMALEAMVFPGCHADVLEEAGGIRGDRHRGQRGRARPRAAQGAAPCCAARGL